MFLSPPRPVQVPAPLSTLTSLTRAGGVVPFLRVIHVSSRVIWKLDLWPRGSQALRPVREGGLPAPCTHAAYKLLLLSPGAEIDYIILFSLQKFPELKFKYVEEEQPEEFFIPYVWSLVYNSAVGLYWNPQDIQLFTMDSD
ncbi:hypothetical protein J1605_004878 [Eschrichtius robustus]|uniref:Dymeclin n=1 Tax=Eschrichtius robustus TaxID=9764 RepID=A0AB34HA11_ESCRO|nr:hypothetical protein J1605_004878 [Eschrichtius robustus]